MSVGTVVSIRTSSPSTSSEGSIVRGLNLGSGNHPPAPRIQLNPPSPLVTEWVNIDLDPTTNAVHHDLNVVPWPLPSDHFDQVHAYEILEHLGHQGDFRGFFDQMAEVYRVLKKDGLFFVTCPGLESRWVWGDPGHTRHITEDTLMFLDQDFYKQVGETSASDYRWYWKGNIKMVVHAHYGESLCYVGRAIK
jgi:hypothetical protein